MTEEAVPVLPNSPALSTMVANNFFMRYRIGGTPQRQERGEKQIHRSVRMSE